MNRALMEKWEPILHSDRVSEITDEYRARVTSQLLENQEKYLAEAHPVNNVTGGIQNWDPILISLVRRMAPKLIAYDVCGVQPMTGPTGLIFAMRAKYGDQNGPEALFQEADTAFSGFGGHAGDAFGTDTVVAGVNVTNGGTGYTDNFAVTFSSGGAAGEAIVQNGSVVGVKITNAGTAVTDPTTIDFSAGAGVDAAATVFVGSTSTGAATPTAWAETGLPWAQMSTTIEKVSVTAQSRQLRADYSLELAQDLRAIHGLDAETELSNILSTELIAEINREIVRTLYAVGKPGAAWATTPGVFDLSTDADGRWSVEKFKGLMFAIERDANAIAADTRRGKGNIIITSADVASALVMTGVLDHNPALQAQNDMSVDATGVTYSGKMGRFNVFVDPYLSTNGYLCGYKGANAYDSGIFYCPYVPLQAVRSQNESTFTPALGFKTRYAIAANPFTTLGINGNSYYRKTAVKDLF